MRTVTPWLVSLFLAANSASAAETAPPVDLDRLLAGMQCSGFTANASDPDLEKWTVWHTRAYLAGAVDAHIAKDPNHRPINADGSDLTDIQIFNWVATACRKHPNYPIEIGPATLFAALMLITDHHYLPDAQ